MKNVLSTVPRTLSHGENTVSNPCEIANVFNNYFVSVADTAKSVSEERGNTISSPHISKVHSVLQKAFDTVDHEILLSKLDYYGIRSISNNLFKSCFSNRKQFVLSWELWYFYFT